MKKSIKLITLISLLLTISNCGLVNLHATFLHNLKDSTTPHFYKAKRSGENSFPENGKAIVNVNFKTKTNGEVKTWWAKRNDDGTFAKEIPLTYIAFHKDGRLESMIEPGKYFLNGIAFATQNSSNNQGFLSSNRHTYQVVSAGSMRDMIHKKPFGYDENKNQARWLSFEVKSGQELYFQDVIVDAKCKSGSSSCDGNDFVLMFKIKDKDSEQKFYKIGFEAEKF